VTSRIRTLLTLTLLAATAAVHANAASITGTVINKTSNKPSAGDTVVLIRLQQSMVESTRTTTDSRGRYTLDVNDSDTMHLVRVTHDKANYFGAAPPGTDTVDVTVYDAATRVSGITEEADVMRLESDAGGTSLHVVENFFVKNDSAPPRTQFSDRPFDFYLPDGAVIEGSAALGPGSMPIKSAPVPLSDAKDHYTFLFPIRPGETRFQVTYSLLYNGSLAFAPRPMLATDTVAVMMPKSMTFTPAANSPFATVNDDVNAQTFVARTIPGGQAVPFTVSGSGQLPRDSQNANDSGNASGQSGDAQSDSGSPSGDAQQQGSAATDTRPGGGLGTPIDTPDPLSKYKWWIIGGLLLLMAGIAGFLVSKPPAQATAAAALPMPNAPLTGSTLSALKEELFTLETDRLSGRINEAEYAEHKAALETLLKRVLQRG
jgi:hypothetical protein